MRALSRQRRDRICEAIRSYRQVYGYPPSMRDVGRIAHIASVSTVSKYLDRLQAEGRVKRDRNINRSIRLVEDIDVSA